MSNLYAPKSSEYFNILRAAQLVTAGMVLSALALESTRATVSKSHMRTLPEIISHDGGGEQSVYILPGCRSDGQFVADHLGVDLAELGRSHTMQYPEYGFSIDDIGKKLLETRRHDKAPASFCVMSMGGMALTHLLRDEEFCQEFGDIDSIVFDSSPADTAHLLGPAKKGVTATRFVPHTPTLSYLYGRTMQKGVEKLHNIGSEGSGLALEHALSTARTPLGAVHPQTRFIDRTHFASGELADVRIGNMVYVSADSDEVVDVVSAHQRYEDVYARAISHVIDETRPSPSHAMGVEHMQLLKDLLTQYYDEPADVDGYRLAA